MHLPTDNLRPNETRITCTHSFFDVLLLVKPRKDGKPLSWVSVTQRKREPLGQPELRPWTTKPGVHLRGTSQQKSTPNFLHELVDIRVMSTNARAAKPADAEPDDQLSVDIRQDSRYQLAGGNTSLLSGSRVYFYEPDRCAVPLEHFRFNGWGNEIKIEGITKTPIKDAQAVVQGAPPKRRRGKAPEFATPAVDLAGNQVCLPDYMGIVMPMLYCMNADFFSHVLTPENVPTVYADDGDGDHNPVLDLDASQKTFRNIKRQLRGSGLVDDSGSDKSDGSCD